MSEDKLKKLLIDAIEIIEWMTGSSDFGPEGQAHEGWLKIRLRVEKMRQAAGISRAN